MVDYKVIRRFIFTYEDVAKWEIEYHRRFRGTI
jgi:hypothetical protein